MAQKSVHLWMWPTVKTPVTPNEYDHHIRMTSTLKGRGQMRFDTYFRMPPSMFEHASEFARQQKTDLSKVCRHALAEYLEKRGINPLMPFGCK